MDVVRRVPLIQRRFRKEGTRVIQEPESMMLEFSESYEAITVKLTIAISLVHRREESDPGSDSFAVVLEVGRTADDFFERVILERSFFDFLHIREWLIRLEPHLSGIFSYIVTEIQRGYIVRAFILLEDQLFPIGREIESQQEERRTLLSQAE